MGQYQQWLHYREVDQHLRTQLEALETELAQLQDKTSSLTQTCPQADNQIMRALAFSKGWDAQATGISPVESATVMNPSTAPPLSAIHQPPQVLSPSLQHWSALLDFSPSEIQESIKNGEESLVPSTPHSELILLPEDGEAILDEQGQTQPQLELPWWLHNIMVSTGTFDRTSPID